MGALDAARRVRETRLMTESTAIPATVAARITETIELIEPVSSGSYGTVFRARELATGQALAVKIASQQLDDPTTLLRFDRECRILERLVHPNIVRHVAHGGTPGEPYWVAMEWLDGETLEELLERSGPAPWRDVAEIGAAVADALGFANASGVVHRDVKPQNIVVLRGEGPLRERVRVIDFGLAWDNAESQTRRLTVSGQVPGTPSYVAPELLAGELPTASSDVYAVGIVLIELLDGSVPFAHLPSQQSLLERMKPNAVVPFDEARAGTQLAAVIRRATERVPGRRYPDGNGLRDALLASLAGRIAEDTGAIVQIAPPDDAAPSTAPSRLPLLLVVGAVVALGVVLALVLLRGG